MKRTFHRWAILAALILATAYGCSGWGSSGPKSTTGFDQAFGLEQDAIDQVTENGTCVDVDGTIICAPDESLPDGRGPVAEALVIDPESGSQVDCETFSDENACVFTLSIQRAGFPDGSEFYAAVRFQENDSYWISGLSPLTPSIQDPSRLELQVRVTGLKEGKSTQMQLAVLVYFPDSDLPPIGTGDLLLRDFGADRVYVVEDVTVTATPSN